MQQLTNFWNTTIGKITVLGGGGIMGLVSLCLACVVCTAVFGGDDSNKPVERPVVSFATETPVPEPTPTLPPTETVKPLADTASESTPEPTNTPIIEESTPTPVNDSVQVDEVPPASKQEQAGLREAQVIEVVDGDTIKVLIDGNEYTVRYILVDTPETKHPTKPVEPFGPEASAANQELVGGKTVLLEKDVSETDQYGRLLRYVYVDDLMVNEELLRRGLAQVSTYPPDVKYVDQFLAIQQEAQANSVGMWGQPIVAAEAPPPTPEPTPEPSEPEPAPALTGGNVVIVNIFYDGVVKQVESDEYVEIANQGGEAVDMTGWRVNAGNPGQDFIFPQGFIMEPGKSCRVYTNEIHPETCGLSFGSGQAIWNNKGDVGLLYNAQGELVSQQGY